MAPPTDGHWLSSREHIHLPSRGHSPSVFSQPFLLFFMNASNSPANMPLMSGGRRERSGESGRKNVTVVDEREGADEGGGEEEEDMHQTRTGALLIQGNLLK